MTSELLNIAFIKYNPRLSETLGRGGAMFVNALQFLLNNQAYGKHHDGKKWVYNTMEQWGKSLKYSTRQIERIISSLQKKQIILVKKLSHSKGNSTNYYTLNTLMLDAIENVKEDAHLLNKKEPNQNSSEEELHIISLSANDKMSVGYRQNGKFYTKKTNKEINNKSDKNVKASSLSSEIIVPNDFSDEISQVQQVKIKKLDLKKEKTNSDIVFESHSLPKTTIAQDMLAIWNNTFEKHKASMSKQLAPLLVAAYKHKFDSDIQKWKQYCLTLASSSYLTGGKFNLSLLWTLKYTTIDRINNNEFGVKEVITSTYSKEDALHHINSVKEAELCKKIRKKLLAVYGKDVYKNWFEELHLELINNEVCFKAKNNFINDYVKSKFGDLVSQRNI